MPSTRGRAFTSERHGRLVYEIDDLNLAPELHTSLGKCRQSASFVVEKACPTFTACHETKIKAKERVPSSTTVMWCFVVDVHVVMTASSPLFSSCTDLAYDAESLFFLGELLLNDSIPLSAHAVQRLPEVFLELLQLWQGTSLCR